jgi:hypothetical protein
MLSFSTTDAKAVLQAAQQAPLQEHHSVFICNYMQLYTRIKAKVATCTTQFLDWRPVSKRPLRESQPIAAQSPESRQDRPPAATGVVAVSQTEADSLRQI